MERPNTQEDTPGGRSPFTEVVTRRTRNRRIQQAKRETVIGTKEDGELQAGERMAWLFVGRLKSTTTAETLKNYLGKNGIDGDVDVEEIQTRGRTKAFRVGFRFSHLEKTESADFWPKGVLALRFLFGGHGTRSFPRRIRNAYE
ncbi:hypothetical protein ANN_11031 [Periplaneta americana]|uniref:RRM domain-containing protein n=1 Tax=Periplaneta americana TaxID=6978 RepID=A0ABQ8T671_PERAM|nr:hypothetical protein ANN_11031 [Periplaneta americana]